nr:polysaccharide deacetylase family protein [Pontibacillus halophilus]
MFENPFSQQYIASIKQSTIAVQGENDPLYKEIEERAADYERPALDASIDSVWKKTPGINGRKVNIEKSYQKMKKSGEFSEDLLVYDVVKPKVHLEELSASPIYRGNPEKEMVSFLINVSWGEEHIPTILETLKEHEVKATFFVEGKWANKHVNLVKMIGEEGHVIGNHAYNHPDMNTLTNEEIRYQIEETNKILKAIIGKSPLYFAPPSGSYNNQVVQIADELGMETILWTVDTVDWKKPTTDVMVNRVLSKIHNGATILMHPTPPVANGLDVLIREIKEKEYKIGTVPSLLKEERND